MPRPEGTPDPVPERTRMLIGYEIYISGARCPMCMSTTYWASIGVVYACDLVDTRKIDFDDAFQHEDFVLPLDQCRIRIKQHRQDLGLKAYQAWTDKEDRHFY